MVAVTGDMPAVSRSPEVSVRTITVDELVVALLDTPPTETVVAPIKPVPVIVSVALKSPSATTVGLVTSELIVGRLFSTVRTTLFDRPPPGGPVNTVTVLVPNVS